MSYTNSATPTFPSTNHRHNQQNALPGVNSPYPSTIYFLDHMLRLAMIVLAPEPSRVLPTPAIPSTIRMSGNVTGSTPNQPITPTSRASPAHSPNARHVRPQITIQVYLHSSSRAFYTNHGLINVEEWCRQLQFSTAFRHLRDQLSEHCGDSKMAPTIRIEAYEAFPDYKVCIAMLLRYMPTTYSTENH